MGPPKTLRKAYRAFKESTKVRIAHVNSDYAELDVAIVKATSHVMAPPKERHLRKIIIATTVVPRVDVVYCIQALLRRLSKTRKWTVAMKTLIVFHRTLREGDPTFREVLLNYSQKEHILELSNFKDDSSPKAWDCSVAVRAYALFLEEKLECFRVLKYDIESERIPSSRQGQDKGHSRTRDLNPSELLEQLPALQKLLHRLVGCQPEGAAAGNCVIHSAFGLVLKESFNIYCAINDGIISLVDKFFEMSRHEAVKALDIYKKASEQAGSLSDFYVACKGLELTRNFQFPVLREPPQSFVTTMEEYITEAPREIPVPLGTLEPQKRIITYKPEEAASSLQEEQLPDEGDETSPSLDIFLVTHGSDVPPTAAQPTTHIDLGDLLSLNVEIPSTSAIEDSSAVPLEIVPNDGTFQYSDQSDPANIFDATEWELPFFSTPISSLSAANERQLAGGLDMLTLDSFCNKGEFEPSLSSQPVYEVPAKNPFDLPEAFASSTSLTATAVEIDANPQLLQLNPFGSHQPATSPQQQPSVREPSNPFGEPVVTVIDPLSFDCFSLNPLHQQVSELLPRDHVCLQSSNPFESTTLL